jgi:hypothetical protein
MIDFKNAPSTTNQEERGNLVDPEEDGKIHTEIISSDGRTDFEDIVRVAEEKGETGCEDVNRIHRAQDRDQWRALVNTIEGGEFLD